MAEVMKKLLEQNEMEETGMTENGMTENGEEGMAQLPKCPVETTLLMIGDKWKIIILRDLLEGTRRFGELKRSVGTISQKVLTSQLRDMEKRGLLIRKVYPEIPPKVEYSLTELGYSLKPITDAMRDWGVNYKNYMEKK